MQHSHVLKKLIFDLLTPFPGSAVGSGGGRGSAGNHVAAFPILCKLICYMTMFWKKLNFGHLTPSAGSGVGGSAGNIFATMLLHS